jgi:hypothetical protein
MVRYALSYNLDAQEPFFSLLFDFKLTKAHCVVDSAASRVYTHTYLA